MRQKDPKLYKDWAISGHILSDAATFSIAKIKPYTRIRKFKAESKYDCWRKERKQERKQIWQLVTTCIKALCYYK